MKLELLDAFDDQISSDVEFGFCTILRGQEVADILSKTHCCSTINYVLKPSSESTPLRLVTNTSFHHLSKSLNDNVVSGLTVLPPILDLPLDFFICPYVSLFDI